MKNTFSSICLAFCFTQLLAQSPFQFNFQAVARNLAGNPLTNESVDFRLSILQGAMDGTSVYIEEQATTTNNFGVANLLVGSGTATLGSLSTVDWAAGPYFLQIELDIQNGDGYQLMGVSALASVPYALHAKTTEQPGPVGPAGPQGEPGNSGQSAYELWLSAGNDGSEEDFLASLVGPQGEQGPAGSGGGGGFSHFLGESFGGGIIFHLWKDPVTAEEHGLIVCPENITSYVSGYPYSTFGYLGTDVPFKNRIDGRANLDSARVWGIEPNTFFSVVDTLNYNGYNDWYVPACYEAEILGNNAWYVRNSMEILGYPSMPFSRFWSSTQLNSGAGFVFDINYRLAGTYSTASSNTFFYEKWKGHQFYPVRRF